jgi:hypothetical protein
MCVVEAEAASWQVGPVLAVVPLHRSVKLESTGFDYFVRITSSMTKGLRRLICLMLT